MKAAAKCRTAQRARPIDRNVSLLYRCLTHDSSSQSSHLLVGAAVRAADRGDLSWQPVAAKLIVSNMQFSGSLPIALPVVLFLAATPPASARVAVGDRAPAVDLVDWQGRTFRLADQKGKVVVIDFWATWCALCRQALPSLDAIAQHFPSERVAVVAINIDTDRDKADLFLSEHLRHPTMTLLRDPAGATLANFGAEGMPAIYVVDANGIVRFAESGYQQERLVEVENAVARCLSPPP